LVAVDVVSGVPEVSSPVLGQVHALDANDVISGVPEVSSPGEIVAVTQIFVGIVGGMPIRANRIEDLSIRRLMGGHVVPVKVVQSTESVQGNPVRIYFVSQNDLDVMERPVRGGAAIKVVLVEGNTIDIESPIMLAYDIDANLPV